MAFREGLQVKGRKGGADQFYILVELGFLVGWDRETGGFTLLPRLYGGDQTVLRQVETAAEQAAGADRPDHGADVERQGVGDFVQQFEWVLALAVDLVDEGGDRDVAQAADFKEFFGL